MGSVYEDLGVEVKEVSVLHGWLLEMGARQVEEIVSKFGQEGVDAFVASAPEQTGHSPYFGRDVLVEGHLILAEVADERLSVAVAEAHTRSAMGALVSFATRAEAARKRGQDADEFDDSDDDVGEDGGGVGEGEEVGTEGGDGDGDGEVDGEEVTELGVVLGVDVKGSFLWLKARAKLGRLLLEAGRVGDAKEECMQGVADAKSVRDLVMQSELLLWTGVVCVLEGDVDGGIQCLEELTESEGLPLSLRVHAGALLGDILYSRNATVDALRAYVLAHELSLSVLRSESSQLDGILKLFRSFSRGEAGSGLERASTGGGSRDGEVLTGRAGRYHPRVEQGLRVSTRVAFVYHRLGHSNAALGACLRSVELASLTFGREVAEVVALFGVFGRVLVGTLEGWDRDGSIFGSKMLLRRGPSVSELQQQQQQGQQQGQQQQPGQMGRTTRTLTQTNVVHLVSGKPGRVTNVRAACFRLARWALANGVALGEDLVGYDFEQTRAAALALAHLVVSDVSSNAAAIAPDRSQLEEFYGLLCIASQVSGMRSSLIQLSTRVGSDPRALAMDELPGFVEADLDLYRLGEYSRSEEGAERSAFEVLAYFMSLRREKDLVPFLNERQLLRLREVHQYLGGQFDPYHEMCTPVFSTLNWLQDRDGAGKMLSGPVRGTVCFQWTNEADAYFTRVDVADEKALLAGGRARARAKRSARLIPVRLLYVVHAVVTEEEAGLKSGGGGKGGKGAADPLATSMPGMSATDGVGGGRKHRGVVGSRRRKSLGVGLGLPMWGGGNGGGGGGGGESRSGSRMGSRAGSRASSRSGSRSGRRRSKAVIRKLQGTMELPLAGVLQIHQMLSKLKFSVSQEELAREMEEAREATTKPSPLNSSGVQHGGESGRSPRRSGRSGRTGGSRRHGHHDSGSGSEGGGLDTSGIDRESSGSHLSSLSAARRKGASFSQDVLRAYQATLQTITEVFAKPLERDENGRILEGASRMSTSLRSISVVDGESAVRREAEENEDDGDEAYIAKFGHLRPPSLTTRNLDLLARAFDARDGVLAVNSSVAVWVGEVIRLCIGERPSRQRWE